MDNDSLVFGETGYARLKWFITIVMPAFGTLYFGLSQYVDVWKPEAVLGILMTAGLFLGTIFGISTKAYNKSEMDGTVTSVESDPDTGIPILKLNLKKTPHDLLNKKTMNLRVDPKAIIPELNDGSDGPGKHAA